MCLQRTMLFSRATEQKRAECFYQLQLMGAARRNLDQTEGILTSPLGVMLKNKLLISCGDFPKCQCNVLHYTYHS